MDRDPGALQHLGRQLLALVNKLDVGQKDLSRRHVVQHHIAQDGSRLRPFHLQVQQRGIICFFFPILAIISSFFLFVLLCGDKSAGRLCSTHFGSNEGLADLAVNWVRIAGGLGRLHR
jgi:hypothetical protein